MKSKRSFIQYCEINDQNFYWIDCVSNYNTSDSCFHYSPYSYFKNGDKIFMTYLERDSTFHSYVRYTLSFGDTINLIENYRDVLLTGEFNYVTLVKRESIRIKGREIKCLVYQYSTNKDFTVGLVSTMYIAEDYYFPVRVYTRKIAKKGKINKRFHLEVDINKIIW